MTDIDSSDVFWAAIGIVTIALGFILPGYLSRLLPNWLWLPPALVVLGIAILIGVAVKIARDNW